ncbi:MAG TPA: 16S rRNA (guanine(966)-N(2))-methyltransferase RsmD [Aeromicrobium sp.]|nr:16S rRNA (guanine(966)-N(2))-methyltransferase RsmD [Aeromicrobium sp.]
MTRIIAGQWGGRRLQTPKGLGTRPTSDRVREALFASLDSELGGFDGLAVLDLFAGSGALGLEAVSRGASRVDLVESNRQAADVIGANIQAMGTGAARVHRMPVQRFVASTDSEYDLVLVDPPYADDIAPVLVAVARLLAPDALVVVEQSSRTDFAWPAGWASVRHKVYGETTLWYGRLAEEVP